MNLPRNSQSLLLCGVLCLYAGVVHAEKADRTKPVHIEAEQLSIDDARQVAVFTGKVVMTQGTLNVAGDQVVATQGPQGLEHATVTGRPAKFRQKREGVDEYVEGFATRIEYDAVTGVMDMYGQARVKRGQDDVRGEHITYDPRTEMFKVFGEQGPVRVVIQPHAESAVQPAEPLSIKPDTRLLKPENK